MRNAQCMSFCVAMQLQNKHTHRAAVCPSVSATNVAAVHVAAKNVVKTTRGRIKEHMLAYYFLLFR